MLKRDFLKTVGSASLLTLLGPHTILGGQRANPKKVLILGGRGFLGPSIVEAFLDAGHEVTLLNRGKTNPHLFQHLPIIICDREKENQQGLKAINQTHKDAYWDIVVDTWQKSPKAVADFLDKFKGRIGHYHYISTVSVYDKWDKKFIVESEPLNPLPRFPQTIEEHFRYAIRKTLAEEAIRERTENYTIYRSHGMKDFRITRPHDPNAEPFWPVRFFRGGEILLPEVPDHHMQVTDINSLTRFILHCSTSEIYGSFNVAHPPTPFKDFIASLMYVTGRPERLHWIQGDFLIKHGLLPYKVVPLWKPTPAGSYYFNVQKALDAGLVNRPMTEMITDQLNGYKSRHPEDDVRFGEVVDGKKLKYYSMEKEQEIIQKWLAEQG